MNFDNLVWTCPSWCKLVTLSLLPAGVVKQDKFTNHVYRRCMLLVIVELVFFLSRLNVVLSGFLEVEKGEGSCHTLVKCCLFIYLFPLWTHWEFLLNQQSWLLSKGQEKGCLLRGAANRCTIG